MLRLPVVATDMRDWVRKTATVVNALLNGNISPFVKLAVEPPAPIAGDSYFDTALNVVRTYDGTIWRNHW